MTRTCIHGPWHGRRVTDAGEFFVPVTPDPPAGDREWPAGCYVRRGTQYVWEPGERGCQNNAAGRRDPRQ